MNYGILLKREISRGTKNVNSNIIELYEGIQNTRRKNDSMPSLFDDVKDDLNGTLNGNGKRNGKTNGNANGNGKMNGNSVMKINGNPNSFPALTNVTEMKTNGNNVINYNTSVISGKVGELGISYLSDKTFTFSINVPQNVVVKLVDFMGINLEGLVDDLCMPGHYVVKFSKNISYNGTAKYQMFVEDEYGDKSLENKPGRSFRLFEEKEIMLL